MKIYVRRRHIKEGKRQNPGRCPVALAFYESSGLRPMVTYGAMHSSGGSFKVSAKVRKFIIDFDSGKPVKPFAFTIRA